jgi:hypothetical protein
MAALDSTHLNLISESTGPLATATFIEGQYCTAILYVDRVEYVFNRADKAAVDDLIDLFDRVLARRHPHGHSGKVRLLYDMRACGPLPFFWLFTRGQEWRRRHPEYVPSEVRMALLYGPQHRFHDSFFMHMVEQFQGLFTRSTHRFGLFESDHQAAVEWLHSVDAPDHVRDAVVRPF